MDYNIEICCFSVEDVINAKKGGATRVELCADKFAGGTTPSYGYVKWVVENVDIKVSMMIRPRGGDFVYTPEEINVMEKDIDAAADIGADCIVMGVMTKDGFLDYDSVAKLAERAQKHGMETTFHRAFDVMREPEQALEQLKKIGVTRILTSGQGATVVEGAALLAKLIQLAGNDISIMTGGGMNETNVESMLKIGAKEVHGAIKKTVHSEVAWIDNGVKMGSAECDDTLVYVTDENRVRIISDKVRQFFGS